MILRSVPAIRSRRVDPAWAETLRSTRPDTSGPTTIEPLGELEFVLARRYESARGQLFAALTEPASLRRWLGVGRRWRMVECELDLRVGGAWRSLWHGPLGQELGAHGLVRDVRRPSTAALTLHLHAPWGELEGLATLDLSESRGGTALLVTVRSRTRALRDAALRGPLPGVLAHSLARLANVAAAEF
jgi:uncharacterized protein YndB with AHSA1/START domain